MPSRWLFARISFAHWVCACCLVCSRAAFAQPSGEPEPVGRYELLANVAYGTATTSLYDLEVEPYGALFGLEAGFTWPWRLRLGAYFDYGLGRSVQQRYDRLAGRDISLTSEAQSASASASLGYDVSLHFLILRYSIDLGITWMRWDFGGLREASLGGYSPMQGTVVGFHVAPRVALLWPVGRFAYGLGMRYSIQFADQIPSGIQGELLVGMAL
jgi:hypothetical protein